MNVNSADATKTYIWYKNALATQVFATTASTSFTPTFPYTGTYYVKEVESVSSSGLNHTNGPSTLQMIYRIRNEP